jgi:site-specific recombinase XerD
VFDQLFQEARALARHRDGPLAEDRRRYLIHCAEQGMALQTLGGVARYTLIIATALRLAERPDALITREEIEAGADLWAGRHPHPSAPRPRAWSRYRFVRHATRWLSFLGRLQPTAPDPQPYADLVAQFVDRMRQERGLTRRTIETYCHAVHDLLARLGDVGLRLDTLTVAQVDDTLIRKVRENGYAPSTVRTYTAGLRAFFRHAEGGGCCCPGLADAIMSPRVYRYQAIPAGLSWQDVKRLFTMTQGERPDEIRTRAVLVLLAVYGLRAGEVAGLRLEDFDWERELLTIRRGKGQRMRTYPLCRLVGDAVLRYLREVRPRSAWREVFLTLRAPLRPLTSDSLYCIVSPHLRALGVTLSHYGPHILRHACASHLLEEGLSLKEIGDYLGHRDPESTRLYAKVDLAGLRAVGDFDLEELL